LRSSDYNIIYTSVSERSAASIFKEELKVEKQVSPIHLWYKTDISRKTSFAYNHHEHVKSHIWTKTENYVSTVRNLAVQFQTKILIPFITVHALRIFMERIYKS
jgi:hypothetical protein